MRPFKTLTGLVGGALNNKIKWQYYIFELSIFSFIH
jgi:hypothetical protein